MPDPISMFYDAAIGEASWESAIGAAARDVGASVLMLGVGDPRNPQNLEMWTRGWDLSRVTEAGYLAQDAWSPDINPGVAAGLIMPVGRSRHVLEMVPEETLARSHFLQATTLDSRKPNQRIYVPMRAPDLLSGGFIEKGAGRDFGMDEVARIDRVIPHLGRALRLRAQIDRQRSVARNLSGVLEDLAYAVMLLDRDGEVVLTNARLEALRQRGDGIAVIRRRPDLGAAANAAVAAALAVVDLGSNSFPSVTGLPIPRRSGLPPYLARLYPGIGFASMAGAGAVRVAVLIDDPLDPAVLPDPALLSAMFGLPPAEAAVARLVPGHLARRAIAEHLGVTENTAKTHLAMIREKLGARTTAEMVRILTRTTFVPPR